MAIWLGRSRRSHHREGVYSCPYSTPSSLRTSDTFGMLPSAPTRWALRRRVRETALSLCRPDTVTTNNDYSHERDFGPADGGVLQKSPVGPVRRPVLETKPITPPSRKKDGFHMLSYLLSLPVKLNIQNTKLSSKEGCATPSYTYTICSYM